MFENVERYAGDPILSLVETFQQDQRAEKVNLSIGFYYDDEGQVPVLKSVHEAVSRLQARPEAADLYLPMQGLEDYRSATQQLVFGADHPAVKEGRIATIQALGGSGALMIGGHFLKRYLPAESTVRVSDPTWGNHWAIFGGAGFEVQDYPYFDRETLHVDFARLKAALEQMPKQTVVLMHPCCHNPTGADLSPAQWDELIPVFKERELLPFFDIAYMGMGDGVDADTYIIRKLAQEPVNFLVANSYSKNFSLYGERVGGLSVVCKTAEEAECVLGQLKATVRRNYSTPARFGAEVVSTVLNDAELKSLWLSEVDAMRVRMKAMRTLLVEKLQQQKPEGNFEHFLTQKGMFSYTGYSVDQVKQLRDDKGVYLIDSGRICIAGLNPHNIDAVATAFASL